MDSVDSPTNGNPFTRFMASGYGRLARIAFGLVLLAVGLFVAAWPIGLALAVASLVPIAAGVFNFCPVAPIWGGHFIGARYCPANNERQGR